MRWEILWNPRYLSLELGLVPYPSRWTCASDIGGLCKHDLHFFGWGWAMMIYDVIIHIYVTKLYVYHNLHNRHNKKLFEHLRMPTWYEFHWIPQHVAFHLHPFWLSLGSIVSQPGRRGQPCGLQNTSQRSEPQMEHLRWGAMSIEHFREKAENPSASTRWKNKASCNIPLPHVRNCIWSTIIFVEKYTFTSIVVGGLAAKMGAGNFASNVFHKSWANCSWLGVPGCVKPSRHLK